MKKFLFLIVALVVILAGVLWFAAAHRKKIAVSPASVVQQPSSVATSALAVNIKEVDKSALPLQFPADVPIETGATITYNFNATNAKGQFQATREFISKKTMDENFKYYQDILKKNGWSIDQATNDAARKQELIFASKANYNLNIRIYTDSAGVKVSINNIVK